MLILEALLFTILICTCVYVTITDIRSGIIENKVLIKAAIFGLIVNVIYYAVYEREIILIFLLNVMIIGVTAILFYTYHIWAAGDSKLLMLVVFLVPARVYNVNLFADTVWILIFTFSTAYIYLIAESVYIGIKSKNLFEIKILKVNVTTFTVQYLCCGIYIFLANQLMYCFFADFAERNTMFMMMLALMIVLTVCSVGLLKNKLIILAVVALNIVLYIINKQRFEFINIKTIVLTGIILILRIIAEKYNYQEIKTENIKEKMVLSYATILGFKKSGVKGLPKMTTEDIRSRISKDEVESILRWQKSKYGKDTITIVRKIPFAIFISLGTLMFILVRMCM